jgi:predicted RNA-binding Zn-ribbon protein involved in translation (DUF1610 family)
MTTIRTTCPQCGEVDMGPEAILLSVRDPAGEGSYRFSCPTCMHTIEKPADRKVVALLLSAGVELDETAKAEEEAEERAREIRSLEPHPSGPPITTDDLIAFHFLLEDDEQLERSLGGR